MKSSAIEVARSAVQVLEAAVRADKQLVGESGAAEEATDEYRLRLEAVLALWIAAYGNLRLSNTEAVRNALDELSVSLQAVANDEIPTGFETGFGRALGPTQAAALGGALVQNQDFLNSSLVPYLEADLLEPGNAGLTLREIAGDRASAWSSRIALYAGLYWTAIWLGAEENLRDSLDLDTVPVRRLLDPRADHCGTCPDKAREYGSWNEMLALAGGLPADGSDDCHSNCRCQIEILQDGEWVGVA